MYFCSPLFLLLVRWPKFAHIDCGDLTPECGMPEIS